MVGLADPAGHGKHVLKAAAAQGWALLQGTKHLQQFEKSTVKIVFTAKHPHISGICHSVSLSQMPSVASV